MENTPMQQGAAAETAEPRVRRQLLVMKYGNDNAYQVVCGREQYHFIKCGRILQSHLQIDTSKYVDLPDADDAAISRLAKKEIVISKADILSAQITPCSIFADDRFCMGLQFETTRGKKRFDVLGAYEPEELRAFFPELEGQMCETAGQTRRRERREARKAQEQAEIDWLREHQNPEVYQKLRAANLALIVSSALLFFPSLTASVRTNPLALLHVLMMFAPYVLAVRFPAYFSMIINRRNDAYREAGVKTMTPCALGLISSCALVLQVDGITVSNQIRLIFPAVVGMLLLTILVCATVRVYRRYLAATLLFVLLLALMQSTLAVTALNALFDGGEPQVASYAVVDKRVTGLRSASYHLLLETEDGEQSYTVYRGLYDETEIGDSVVVETYPGAFGIRNADVWSVDEWEAVQAETN